MPNVETGMLPKQYQRTSTMDINPAWQEAENAFVSYARKTGMLTGQADTAVMLSFGFGRFTGWAYPNMPTYELNLLTQWHYWLTVADDVADAMNSPHGAHRLRRHILDATSTRLPPEQGGPVAASFHHLWWRTAPAQSTEWQQRARASLALYLSAWASQSYNRSGGHIVTTHEYIDLRRRAVGLDINTDVLEALHHITLPAPLFATSSFRELRNCFVDANAWFNDYYSYEREATSGENHNLAIVLAHNQRMTPGQALDRVLEMINTRLTTFLQIERELPDLVAALGYPDEVATEVLRYTQALRDYTYGHVAWSSTSTRYNDQQLRATEWNRAHHSNDHPARNK
ncbi:terpene synthase family protein [Streptomyces cellulosae]